MKKVLLSLLLLSSLSIMAQEQPKKKPKLEALRNEKNQTVLKQKIKALENGTEDDMEILIQYYRRDAAKKYAATKSLLKKYPQSKNASQLRIGLFLDVSGLEETQALLNSMIKDYPTANLDIEKCLTACAYAEIPNTTKILALINTIEDPIFKLSALSQNIEIIAGYDNTAALNLATQELAKYIKIKGQTEPRGAMKINPKLVYDEFITMYSKLLFKAGKNVEAYKYTSEAYNNNKNTKDGELIENYAFLSSLNGKYEEALPILAKAVKDGKNEERYIEQVRKGYEKLNPGKDVNAYIASLQKDFITKIQNQVSKLMINETAPDFTVTDINGKTVSLADFKGKTIVLDFWATWCAPCVASFPAMQMAVNRYKNDPGVKFLFIHTWNNDLKNPLSDAKNFLSKHNYNFDLYMDPRDLTTKESPAATAFKLTGIPAKFVIDGNGRIRFKLAGFEGKPEPAAEEVIQMIEMARKGA